MQFTRLFAKLIGMKKKTANVRRVRTNRHTTTAEIRELERLGAEFSVAVAKNDDRGVRESMSRALNLIFKPATGASAAAAAAVESFEQSSRMAWGDAVHEYVTSCLNIGHCVEGLAALERLAGVGLVGDAVDATCDRAELLTRVGRGEEAERLLHEALSGHERETRLYVALGDIHYHWQELEEQRDCREAEAWYYRAFDLGLAKDGTDAARELLEHLGDACLDRLRQTAEARLLDLLKGVGLGWRTLLELRDSVWHDGAASHVLRRLAKTFAPDLSSADAADRLRTLFTSFEHMPQEVLGGYSSFERTELMPPGRHETRLLQEIGEAFMHLAGSEAASPDFTFASEEFQRFQKDYLEQVDPYTGRRRVAVITDEREETRHRFEAGESQWFGFVRYRE